MRPLDVKTDLNQDDFLNSSDVCSCTSSLINSELREIFQERLIWIHFGLFPMWKCKPKSGAMQCLQTKVVCLPLQL